ncbi:MAG: TIGR00730 family Rossman fold protein [Bacteroidota bacterium]
MKSTVVFCGSSEGNDDAYTKEAYALGKLLGKQQVTLVYGAARIGIMGQVAQGALDHEGTVIGVIPDFLKLKEVYHTGLKELIITQDMHQRKLKMHELSDSIIMLPGGYGTLEEFFEMLTWAQLGLHHKPIGILNTNGFYNSLMNMLKHMVGQGFVKQENYNMILIEETIEGLLDQMRNYIPLSTPKWIKKDQV